MLLALLFICLTGSLLAQIAPPDPAYYQSNRERFDGYIFRTYTDPARLGWLLIDSAKDTCYKDPHQWGRSAESYSFRVASGWGRRIVRNTAMYGFETLLHEDSRYRPSGEKGLRKRITFAIRNSVLAYKADGSMEPAYGRMAAGVVGAAISSTWHPQSIEPSILLQGIGQSAIDRAGNNLLAEFEPDLKRVGRKTWESNLQEVTMQSSTEKQLGRRSFLTGGAAVVGTTALSYGRIPGANDRVSLGHIGVGRRGRELASVAAGLKDGHQVEMTAVCDLWKVNRERAVQAATRAYGRAPRSFQYLEDLLALNEVDAVIISTADFQHAPILKLVAEAGKDAYCEKPMANVLEEAKAARDAVRSRKLVVQIGTQHRSEPYQIAAKEWISRGVLGQVSKAEIVWNFHGPRWRGRSEVKEIREQDTDWSKWLLTKPYRPFDPRAYFEFRLYKEFSSGIADQWMSHGIDMIHYLLDDHFPKSVVAFGGVFAWPDGRETPDTFQALLEYPSGFMVSYSTSFGNDSDSFTRLMGKKGTLVNVGGEGSPRWKLVEEKGTHEANPFVHRRQKLVTLNNTELHSLPWHQRLLTGAVEKTYGSVPFISDSNPSHMKNWFECLRSRKEPNATVDDGFAHSVAVIMAARAQQEGKKLYWDRGTEQILDGPPEVNLTSRIG